MLTFQQILAKLTAFWEAQGCVIHQGHDLEVGAGTFNPATFLRCLGPEPYKTAYIEPSRRPADGRYGQNPNRVQLFHQFQVIIKPSPENIQQLYLESLRALGMPLEKHDIRFVHDDWESPTLGAWGLGWEVWCDGMEISQFTYFQAIASLPLKPISVEITYGLERLCLFLQNKESIFDMQWNDTLNFRDIIHQNEVEWSAYNFTHASTEMWLRHFEDFEKEATRLCSLELPIPAYDFVIKASHAFNLLDARGAISVSERTKYIARIRDLAREIALAYLKSRENLGFPLLPKEKVETPKALKQIPSPPFQPSKSQDFLLEIGSEQLPATFIPIGCRELEKGMRALLEKYSLHFDELQVFGTPQRLSILISGLAEGTKTEMLTKRGPPVSTAFDEWGKATPQGQGFLKAFVKSIPSLDKIRESQIPGVFINTLKDTEYLFVQTLEQGLSTFEILANNLPSLILNLEFPKEMRWGEGELCYARPIRWILCLFGAKVVPFSVGTIVSGRKSCGHAQRAPAFVSMRRPADYLPTLKKYFVLADAEERKQSILKQLRKIEAKEHLTVIQETDVMKEVLYLTEWPTLTLGSFREEFLKAPAEVLISEMVEHQRYFPLVSSDGTLDNTFVITADNKPSPLICHGNEKVLSARLSDGVFLYSQDLQTPLISLNEKLKTMTYMKGLGSMWDKVERLQKLSHIIYQTLQMGSEAAIKKAALLSKADLASHLVYEFPELQGTIGKYYAIAQGEGKEVADALEEQWMPRSESAPLPKTKTGVLLSIADKLDNLISCYSLDLKPTSSSDPYALRRQAIGIIKILIDQESSLELKPLLLKCCAVFSSLSSEKREEIAEEILHFISARAKSVFEEFGFRKDEIESGIRKVCSNPYDQFCKIKALHAFRLSREFPKLLEVYKRAKGQLTSQTNTPFQTSLATEPAEKALVDALNHLEKNWPVTLEKDTYITAFHLIASLQQPLAHLFESVKILSDDPKIKDNRIALLQKVFAYFDLLVDLKKLC